MNSTPETRYTLIGKLQNPQDAEAWAEFTNIYQPLIFRICRKRGLQHADATDVTQEVLSKVAKAVEKFSHQERGATFRGWLYRVTQNLVIDFLRKRDRNFLVQAEDAINLAGLENDDDSAESAEFRLEFQRQIFQVVAREVQNLVQPKTWSAFWQTEIERKSVEAVAKDLGVSAGSIYVSRSRVIAKLRQAVDRRLTETQH